MLLRTSLQRLLLLGKPAPGLFRAALAQPAPPIAIHFIQLLMSEDLKTRVRGIAALAIAALLGWRGIWQPLQDAKAHVPELRISSVPLALTPALTVVGLFFLIGGNHWELRDPATGRYTIAAWWLMAVTLSAAGLTLWYVLEVFTSQGY